jgi:predicted RND superfamily exporter protein/outer membrane lipoprotein-sorting protein
VVLAAVATILLGSGISRLTIIIDPTDTLPQTHPFVVATNLADRLFNNKFAVVIGLTPAEGNALQPAVLTVVRKITNKLAGARGVVRTSILSLTARKAKDITGDADGLEIQPLLAGPRTTGEPDALRKALQRNPIYSRLLISDDLRTTAVIAEFRKDPAGFHAIAARVEAIVAPFRSQALDITVGGQPILLGEIEAYSDRMLFLFPLALVIVGLIHFEAFRSWQGVVLPLLTGLMSVIWALGAMGWTRTPLDAFNATTPILVLAIAAGHAVQILKRYYEEYARELAGAPRPASSANVDAVVRTMTSMGPVMAAAGLTAALSFLSLMVFEIRTIRTFGLFTAMGIASALVIELTFIPALRAMLSPPGVRQMARERLPSAWGGLAAALSRRVRRDPRAVLAVTACVFALACGGAGFVHIDNSLRAFFRPSVPARHDDIKLNRLLAGTNVLEMVIQGHQADAIKRPNVLRAMDATQRYLERDSAVGKTMSVVDFVRQIDRALNDDPDLQRPLPVDPNMTAQLLLLYSMSGDPSDFDSYVDPSYRNAAILVYLKKDNSEYVTHLIDGLRDYTRKTFPPDVDVAIGGNVTSSVALNEVLVRNKMLNIAQIALVVFVISSLLFGSLLGGVLVLVPVTMAVAINFGLMGWMGIPLQVATATVSAMAVGIGADYAIYFMYRLREEAGRGAPFDVAMDKTFHSAGKAVMYVSTAIAGGYAVMMLSWGFMIHFWLGLLISVAMVTSACTAVTTLPALLVLIRPRFIFSRRPPLGRAPPIAAVLIGGLLLASPVPALAEQLSAVEVMQQNFLAQKISDTSADATFVLISADGQRRVRKTHSWTKLRADSTDNMRLVRFISPPDIRGTATLTIENSKGDDDIWIYLPALKRVRRLLASNKKDSFVGTDFSYGDIIGFRVERWRHTILRSEPVDGAPCFVLESTPAVAAAQEDSGYSKRVQWIRADNFVTVKGAYYDADNRLWKTYKASELALVEQAHNRWQPMRMEMDDVQSGHKTVLQLENFKANQGLADSLFTARALTREP